MIPQIIDFINEEIKNNVFVGEILQKSSINGIVYYIPRSNEAEDLVPSIFENKKQKLVELTDKLNIIIYHTIKNSTKTFDNAQYGDANNIITNNIICSMFVYINGKNVEICKEDLDVLINSYFPTKIDVALKSKLKITDCYITPLSTDFDGYALYKREYKLSQFNLKPYDSFFEIKYQIKLKTKKDCINKCSCI